MSYEIGDLVSYRNGYDLGNHIAIIIEKKQANEGLNNSEHTKHLSNILRDVYYLLIPNVGRAGPYYASELRLERKHDAE